MRAGSHLPIACIQLCWPHARPSVPAAASARTAGRHCRPIASPALRHRPPPSAEVTIVAPCVYACGTEPGPGRGLMSTPAQVLQNAIAGKPAGATAPSPARATRANPSKPLRSSPMSMAANVQTPEEEEGPVCKVPPIFIF